MIKADIVSRVAQNARMSDYEAKIAVEATIDVIQTALQNGESVMLRGFGVFKIKVRAPKSVRDINNGQQYKIGCRKRVVFQPGNNLNIM